MRRSNRRFRQSRQMLTDLSLTPLIDTSLTLLIIFIVAAPMMNNSIRVNLPKGKIKENTSAQQHLIVTIDKKGNLFLNDKATEEDNLMKELKEIVKQEKEKTVSVRADQEVSYGVVMELLDAIKIIDGVEYVALATTKTA